MEPSLIPATWIMGQDSVPYATQSSSLPQQGKSLSFVSVGGGHAPTVTAIAHIAKCNSPVGTVYTSASSTFTATITPVCSTGGSLFQKRELLPSVTLCAVIERSLCSIHKAAIKTAVSQCPRTPSSKPKRFWFAPQSSVDCIPSCKRPAGSGNKPMTSKPKKHDRSLRAP